MSVLLTSISSDHCPWSRLDIIWIVILDPPDGWLRMTSGNTIQSNVRTDDNTYVPPIFNYLSYSLSAWWVEAGPWGGLRWMPIIAPCTWVLGMGWLLAAQIKVTLKPTTALWFVRSSIFWIGWRSEEWQWGNYCCYDSCRFPNSLANRLEGRKTRLRSGLRQLNSWKRVLPISKGSW